MLPSIQQPYAINLGLTLLASGLATGADDSGHGQMAQILHETLTAADSTNKTVGVASALGNALAAMAGKPAEVMANQTIEAINELATDISCSVATDAAACKQLGPWPLLPLMSICSRYTQQRSITAGSEYKQEVP